MKNHGFESAVSRLCVCSIALLLYIPLVPGQEIKVTLLGTGSPLPEMHRFGPSILVEAGGRKLLFDAGRGALQRLWQINMQWSNVEGVFLTHLHSDHVVGFPDLWLTGWLVSRRNVPLKVWGPRGTQKMMGYLEQAYEYDIRIRLYDDRALPEGVVLLAEDISESVVDEVGGVKVTAFEVDHSPIKPAFGYRIDYAGRSVVLSGDTRVSDNLIRYAQGADLLIHEVVAPEAIQRAGISLDLEPVKPAVGYPLHSGDPKILWSASRRLGVLVGDDRAVRRRIDRDRLLNESATEEFAATA